MLTQTLSSRARQKAPPLEPGYMIVPTREETKESLVYSANQQTVLSLPQHTNMLQPNPVDIKTAKAGWKSKSTDSRLGEIPAEKRSMILLTGDLRIHHEAMCQEAPMPEQTT